MSNPSLSHNTNPHSSVSAYPSQSARAAASSPSPASGAGAQQPDGFDVECGAEPDWEATPRVDPDTPVDATAIWQAAQSELALTMPRETYNTWLRDTRILGYEDGEFIIGIPNAYARDWLENRLRPKIKRVLTELAGRSVQVNFQVSPPAVQDAGPAPLYEITAADAAGAQERGGPTWQQGAASGDTETPPETAGGELAAPARQPPKRNRRDALTAREVHPGADGMASKQMDGTNTVQDYPRKTMQTGSKVNPLNTFDTFVVGNHNRLAHAAASAVADQPGQSFNPLFIYGGVGLGKTHLLHAIGNRAFLRGYHMIYCSSEQFTNDLISAIRNQNTDEFRNKYRQVDILLIDDIQFIGGKESTQEEFFHTFNHLHSAGRQVVLSSDRPPKALGTLEERLRSRFEGGLQTDISQPDFETRVAILQSKASKTDIPIQLEVLMLVAERVDSNVRELEGTLNRIIMQAKLVGSALNLALAERILQNLAPQRTPRSPAIVIQVVAENYHRTAADLTGRSRTKDIAHARQVAMYLLREENALSLPAIGEQLGGRDHSTVRYGVDKIATDVEQDEALRREIASLREKIYAAPGT